MRLQIKFAITASFLLFFAFTSLAVHEFGHALLASLLGGTASISYGLEYGWLPWGATTYLGLDARQATIADAGALVGAAILIPLWWGARCSSTPHDAGTEFAAYVTMWHQLVYGFAEVWYDSRVGDLTVQLWALSGYILGTLIAFPKLRKWLKQ